MKNNANVNFNVKSPKLETKMSLVLVIQTVADRPKIVSWNTQNVFWNTQIFLAIQKLFPFKYKNLFTKYTKYTC